MLKWSVTRDCDTFRARKIVIEIYDEVLVHTATGPLVTKKVYDRSRMFGGLLSTPRALARLERRINRRLAKRLAIAHVYKTAGFGG